MDIFHPKFKPGDKVVFIKRIMDKTLLVSEFRNDLKKHDMHNQIFTVKECTPIGIKLNEMNEEHGWYTEWNSNPYDLELAPAFKQYTKLRGLYEK